MPRAFLVKKMCQASRWNSADQDTENNSLSEPTGPYDLTLKLKKNENTEEAPSPALAMIGASYNQQYDFPLEPLSPNVPSTLRSTLQRPYYPTYFSNFGGQATDVYYYPLPTPYTFQGQTPPTFTTLSSSSSSSSSPREHLPPSDVLRFGRCLDSNQKDRSFYPDWTPDTPSPSPERHAPIEKPEGRYNCATCDKSYTTYSGLSKHRQFHCTTYTKKSFNCKHCDKVYISLGALKMHIRTHTLPCKCKLCGKAFSRPWLLQGHIRTHTGEKPFACQHCSRAFADRSNLRAHLQTHSDVKKYSCKTCTKTFSRMSLLTKHEEGGGCLGTNQELRSS